MELERVYYEKADYVRTASGNKVNRKSNLFGSQNIVMNGKDCVIMAAEIGSFVHIGRGAVVGRNAVIKSCVQILPDTVVPHDAVIPPFSLVSGNPGVVIGELSDSTEEMMTQATVRFYKNFVPKPESGPTK